MHSNHDSKRRRFAQLMSTVLVAALLLVAGCELSSETDDVSDGQVDHDPLTSEQLANGEFSGYHTCTTDADCPQYYTGCYPYVAPCQKDEPWDQWFVGPCECNSEKDVVAGDCLCEECEQGTGLVDTGRKLCFREYVSCDADADCDYQPGLECVGGEVCSPSREGLRACETDADCLFGWDCTETYPNAMCSQCRPPLEMELRACCSPRVCVPRGWIWSNIACD